MKKTVFAALSLAMALLCGTALAKDEIVVSGGDNAVAGKFDPVRGYGVWGPDIFHCHLLKPGKDNLLEKDLATDEKVSEDGLRYTYEIREDAKFADGHPLTAEDVVFDDTSVSDREYWNIIVARTADLEDPAKVELYGKVMKAFRSEATKAVLDKMFGGYVVCAGWDEDFLAPFRK